MLKLQDHLKQYRKDLQSALKNNSKLNESGTRLLVNDFLKNVLGYTPNEDIKTEYEIGGGYADYVVQIGKKKKMVVEVKALSLKLNENHLRQSLGYAAEEGIDWILLLNGKQVQLYKVMFAKPVYTKLVFDLDLQNDIDFKKAINVFEMLTKKAMTKNQIDEYWKKIDSLSPVTLSKYLFDESILKLLKKNLKTKTEVNFSTEDINNALYEIVTTSIFMLKPKIKVSIQNKKTETDNKEIGEVILLQGM